MSYKIYSYTIIYMSINLIKGPTIYELTRLFINRAPVCKINIKSRCFGR